MSEKVSKQEFVESVEVRRGDGVFINGERFPYWIHAQPPRVEPLEDHNDLHILWLPLIAEGRAPTAGPPDGEPIDLESA